jgi:hypothetical protein
MVGTGCPDLFCASKGKILGPWQNWLNKGGKLAVKIDPISQFLGYKTVDKAKAIEYGEFPARFSA